MALDRILFIADLHCGSRFGLCGPRHWGGWTHDAVKWLYGAFEQMRMEIPRPNLLCLNGDLIDGHQQRAKSTGILTSCLAEQVEIASDLLKPWIGWAKKTVRLEGTSYHESFDGALQALDLEYGIWRPDNPVQRVVLDLDLGDGVGLNVKHQPEGEMALYEGTVRDRELLWSVIAEHLHHLPEAHFLIRSHVHHYSRFDNHSKTIVATPCWSLQPLYAVQKRRYRWIPDLGVVWMERDKREDLGWRIQRRVIRPEASVQVDYAQIV